MNTKEMLSVIELSKTLSFREAADRLFLSQPALSYQISSVENEIGFPIFDRKAKAVALTPAGRVFVKDIEKAYRDILAAIERGQNFSSRYEKEIRVGLPRRSYYSSLPLVMERMGKTHPEIAVVPVFSAGLTGDFHKGDVDVLIGDEEDLKGISGGILTPLYRSPIRLLTRKNDVLTTLKEVTEEDIVGRTLLVGAISRKNLRKLQLKLEKSGLVQTMNSDSHDTTLTLVASGKAICLSPDFYKAEGGNCAFLPFKTDAYIQISALVRENDARSEIREFVHLLQEYAK